MIHDAIVEVTCDHDKCAESAFVGLDWVYRNIGESSGFYDYDRTKIEDKLLAVHDWIVCNGRHFCSDECSLQQCGSV